MKIGLLGFGVVGRGVYDITAKRDDMQVAKVVCLEDVFLPDAEVTRDFKRVLEDDSIDTIIEAMGGLHPAYEFVRAAIEAGKNVVTSNKALVATFYDELLPLAEQKGVKFRCTAAVGGGIGWLSEVERSRRIQTIHQVGGIMNGTCNYILDSMTRLGMDYADALRQAQKLGYAEANPSTDVKAPTPGTRSSCPPTSPSASAWTRPLFPPPVSRIFPPQTLPTSPPRVWCASWFLPASRRTALTAPMSSPPCSPWARPNPLFP